MILVELFSKRDCHLCDEAKAVLDKVQRDIPFTLKEIKLAEGDDLFGEYGEIVPVVRIDKVVAFKYRVSEKMLKIRLQQAATASPRPRMDDGEEKP